jgi:hypothetical protein
MTSDTDSAVRQIQFKLEKAERGMALPYDAERAGSCATCCARPASESCRRGWRSGQDYLTGTDPKTSLAEIGAAWRSRGGRSTSPDSRWRAC